MSEKELEKYLEIVNHFISDDGNLEEIKKYIAHVLYDVDKNYKQEIERLKNIINELEKDIENRIYMIEPKGTSINFDTCNYECEEDYINGMELKAELNTCKSILNKLQELKGSDK